MEDQIVVENRPHAEEGHYERLRARHERSKTQIKWTEIMETKLIAAVVRHKAYIRTPETFEDKYLKVKALLIQDREFADSPDSSRPNPSSKV